MLNGRLRGVNPLANTGWIDDSNTIFNTKTIVFIILPVSTDTPNPLLYWVRLCALQCRSYEANFTQFSIMYIYLNEIHLRDGYWYYRIPLTCKSNLLNGN